MKKIGKMISIIFLAVLISGIASAKEILIKNEQTGETIAEEDFLIELPKISEQISTQTAKAVVSVVSGKKKAKVSSFNVGETIELASEQIIPWGVERVNAPAVWDKVKGRSIKVAIIDTGIDYNHPDLNVAGGVSLIDDDYMDYDGHGTAVAGVISALDNELGVIGVAPEVELYAVKVFTEEGAFLSDILYAIDWAIENEMDVISMSFGTSIYSQALEYKLTEAYESGILLVASAGNGEEEVVYPAKFSSVIAVGNTNENNNLYSSNYGEELELVAPGTNILTTYLDNGYVYISGTSFSAPHVAGILSLILENNSELSIPEIRIKLHKDAVDLGDLGKDIYFGYGLAQINLEEQPEQGWNSFTSEEKLDYLKERTDILFFFLEFLSSSWKKKMVCGYMEENHLELYDSLGLSCTATYRILSSGRERVTCRCESV